jgi:hypothetical protein
MTTLPMNTLLGKLELIEVYEYYDKPLLFACKNASGTHYLVVQTDSQDDFETWFYVSLSFRRFLQVRSGEIDLHEAFASAEDGFVFDVKIFGVDHLSPTIEIIPTRELNHEQLPDSGEKLNLEPILPSL